MTDTPHVGRWPLWDGVTIASQGTVELKTHLDQMGLASWSRATLTTSSFTSASAPSQLANQRQPTPAGTRSLSVPYPSRDYSVYPARRTHLPTPLCEDKWP